MDRRTSLLLVSVTFALLAACTKTESETPPTPTSASATTPAPAASSAAPSPVASASASAPAPEDTAKTATKEGADAGSPAPTAAPEAPKTASASSGGPATPVASASASPAQCGTKPLPDCPLQAWMKANVNPPVLASDTAALATALDKVVGLAPAGYPNWVSVAKDGAAAARSGDLAAAKASCRTCHDQYKAKYKNEMRTRKI